MSFAVLLSLSKIENIISLISTQACDCWHFHSSRHSKFMCWTQKWSV